MERDENFIDNILTLRDYWLAHSTDKKEAVDGFIHSLLVMFDGDAGVNDFHFIQLVDTEEMETINDRYPLHELFHIENNKRDQ